MGLLVPSIVREKEPVAGLLVAEIAPLFAQAIVTEQPPFAAEVQAVCVADSPSRNVRATFPVTVAEWAPIILLFVNDQVFKTSK